MTEQDLKSGAYSSSKGFTSEFLKLLVSRGYMQDCTAPEALDARLTEAAKAGRAVPVYIGFDPTADSLHVGSLVQIMMLRAAQKSGLKPIFLMGGGTGLIGDPSLRDESRPLATPEVIQSNIENISKIFSQYVDLAPKFETSKGSQGFIVNNAEWLMQLGYIDLLREVGVHFTVSRMLSFESVKTRLSREQSLTFLEFNYMILQAYDFVELNLRYGCELQIGGSDQWGNIVNGIELGRRKHGLELFGITSPLLTTASGAKMGKSLGGAIWLNEERLSTYDFWQYWRNTEDADVGRFLRMFTELPLDDIARLEALEGAEINAAKKCLADEVTRFARGADATVRARETAEQAFEAGGIGEDLPIVEISPEEAARGLSVIEALKRAGLTQSNGEGRRMIVQNAVRLNGEAIIDPNCHLELESLRAGEIKLSCGKKRHAVIRVAAE